MSITGYQVKPVLKIRAIAIVIPYETGYNLGNDSLTVFRGKKYIVKSIELLNKNGKPVSIQERHSEGFAHWNIDEFPMLIKDSPEAVILLGWIKNFGDQFLYLNQYKLTIVDRDKNRHLLICKYYKTIYFINYY